jgi:hypothetical protein
MANANQPQGLVPERYLDGTSWNGGFNTYFIPQADANAYYVGDVVKSAANADANGLPAVTKAAGTDTIRGVVIGYVVAGMNSPSLVGTNLDLSLQFIPATKTRDYYVMVVDDPTVLFSCQDNGTAIPATNANKNCSLTVTAPTSPQQNSATVILSSSVAVTASLPYKLFGRIQTPSNEPGANAKWLLKVNQHELNGATAGV